MSAVIEVSVRRQVVIEVVRNRGAVYSVNGKTGAVVLNHEDVGADPAGAAAAALTAANTHTDDGLTTKQDRISGPLSPVEITAVGTNVTVAAAEYYIAGLGEFSSPESGFAVALSSADNVRYVGYYGNADGEVIKVEGEEGSSAIYPTTPENTAPLGFQLVTDAGIGEPEEPGTVNFADIGGNASDNASLVDYVAQQIAANTPGLAVLQTSFATTSASFVDVPEMSVTLIAGKKYLIDGFLIAIPPFGGGGSAFQLVMPPGTVSIVGNLNDTDAIFRRVTELTATGAFPNQNPNVQLSYVRFSGSINVSATGPFKLQTKSVVFSASHQVLVKPHSTWWRITEIP